MPGVKILEWAWWWEASKRPSEKDGKPFSESGDKIVPINWPPLRHFWSDIFNNNKICDKFYKEKENVSRK